METSNNEDWFLSEHNKNTPFLASKLLKEFKLSEKASDIMKELKGLNFEKARTLATQNLKERFQEVRNLYYRHKALQYWPT